MIPACMGRWLLGVTGICFLPLIQETVLQGGRMTTDPTFTIVNGPSREELFDALRLFHNDMSFSFTPDIPAPPPAYPSFTFQAEVTTHQVDAL